MEISHKLEGQCEYFRIGIMSQKSIFKCKKSQ